MTSVLGLRSWPKPGRASAEVERPDFESLRIAALWCVRGNLHIHLNGGVSRDVRWSSLIYQRYRPAFAEAPSRRTRLW
jgi:hypothetical protein